MDDDVGATEPTPRGASAPPPPTPSPSPPPRRLTRSRHDRVLGGVAGGFARYLGVEPVLVRIGFVLATFLAGIGVVVYIAGWLLIPDEDGAGAPHPRRDFRQILGFAVAGVGALVVLGNLDLGIDEQWLWALGLIAIGGAVLWARGRDSREADADTGVEAETAAVRSPETSVGPAPTVPASGTPAWSPPPTPPASSRARPWRPRWRPASLLGPLTLCALAVWAGVAAGLHALGAVDVGLGVVVAGALLVIGAALLVGACWGRARWLVVLGVALTLVAAAWSALDLPLAAGIGERNYHPTSFAVLEDGYELGVGSLHLDLRDLDFTGRRETVRVRVGIGELHVWVPDGVRVVVDGRVGLGELQILGGQQAGGAVEDHVVRDAAESDGALHLELQGGMGSVKVLDADDEGGRR